jgi:hypothetical protein
LSWKKIWIASVLLSALAPWARAQAWGIGGSVGWVNDVGNDFRLSEFNPSEVTGWVDYRFEKHSLLRFTYGSMRTQQGDNATITVPEDGGPPEIRELKERINYGTLGVSYLLWEGFFTSGLFGGIGGYHFKPDAVPPGFEGPHDVTQTVFGWHFGSEAIFRVYKNVSLVARLTYHNVLTHPHRQFVNVGGGVVARF